MKQKTSNIIKKTYKLSQLANQTKSTSTTNPTLDMKTIVKNTLQVYSSGIENATANSTKFIFFSFSSIIPDWATVVSVKLKFKQLNNSTEGAVLGAGVGGIIGAGGAVLTSAMSSVTNKFISDLFAYTLTGTSFGTWEDYAVAFISGGLIKRLGMKGIVKTAYDVVLRPAINQVVKIGTNRTETFSVEKYAYDVVTRGITTFAPSPWKAFYRGWI